MALGGVDPVSPKRSSFSIARLVSGRGVVVAKGLTGFYPVQLCQSDIARYINLLGKIVPDPPHYDNNTLSNDSQGLPNTEYGHCSLGCSIHHRAWVAMPCTRSMGFYAGKMCQSSPSEG